MKTIKKTATQDFMQDLDELNLKLKSINKQLS